MNKNVNCHKCIFFNKSPGIRNYFIFFCSFWGLKSINKLPYYVIFESIGKECPFFKQKKIEKNKTENMIDKNNKNETNFSEFA